MATTLTAPDDLSAMSTADKRYYRARLLEELAILGEPTTDVSSPGQLAQRHDRLYQARPHLELIDKGLTWMHATPGARLMVFTPPQVGKSLTVSRWFPFWWLTLRPRDRIVLASYASRLAASHGAAARDLVQAFGADYGLRLSATESTRADWTLTTGGGVRSRGVRSGLTGQPMDLGIIDDPVADRAQADSPVVRAAVWEWYSSTFVSRKSPSARELVVMTRWHPDDLAGKLLERDGRLEDGGLWKVIHLPAIAVAENREKGFYPDPLGRAPGEPLTHPRFESGDVEGLRRFFIQRRAVTTTKDWNSLYQGVPFDAEGALLSEVDVQRATVHRIPDLRRVAVGVDPSGGGRDEAGLVAGGLGADGRMYLTRNRTSRMASDRWAREACLLAIEVDADRIIVERNFGGDMCRQMIRQAWDHLQGERGDDGEPRVPAGMLPPMIQEVTARRSKVLRAEPIAQAIKTGRVFFGDGHDLKTLKAEWQTWEPGSTWSPGALDASVHLVTELLPPLPAGAVIGTPTGRRRGEVGRGTGRRIDRRA